MHTEREPVGATSRRVHILVAEDHEGYREFACHVLRQSGFEVTQADNGKDALFAIAADPSIDLLVTDIVMPGPFDGWSLAARAKSLRPQLRVIYMTGVETALPQAGADPGYGPLLPKPWTAQQLLSHVGRVLGTTPGPRQRGRRRRITSE
jgi:DNA-binding NtrC family response regulator